MRKFVFGASVSALVVFLGCTANNKVVDRGPASKPERIYELAGYKFPLHSLEVVPDGEVAVINSVDKIFENLFKEQYGAKAGKTEYGAVLKGTRRGVHPKQHGCAVGTMEFKRDLWDQDVAGIFQQGAKYDVVMRFSNAGPRPANHDSAPDSRGLGIKVLNVRGPHVLGSSALRPGEAMSQDFTLNSTDTFFADSAARYVRFMDVAINKTADFQEAAQTFMKNEFLTPLDLASEVFEAATLGQGPGLRIVLAFLGIKRKKTTNPLGIDYYSISPSQHGRGSDAPVVKYRTQPCNGEWQEPIDEANPNYLRANLKKHLQTKEACFSFQIQRNVELRMSIEDLTIPWSQAIAPFEEVARIKIPKQALMNESKCEELVINPWNSIPEHKPVGGINRMRLGSYLHSIKARRATNGY